MIEKRIAGRRVQMYNSIEELPLVRFHKYNKFMLLDSGIGSDLNAVSTHVGKAKAYAARGDKENTNKTLDNLTASLFMVAEELSPKHLALCCFVYSINGRVVTDLSDEGIRQVYAELNNETKEKYESILDAIKKKVETELGDFFPGRSDSPKTLEFYDNLIARAKAKIKGILEKADVKAVLEEIEARLLELFHPVKFLGPEGAETRHEKNFQDLCLFIRKETTLDPSTATTLEFYNAFEYVKKQIKTSKNGR